MLGRQDRRRAAAEEHGGRQRGDIPKNMASQPQLQQHRIDVASAADAGTKLVRGVGVEVAVATPGEAERDVYVDPERDTSGGLPDRGGQPSVGGRQFAGGQRGWHGSSLHPDGAGVCATR